MVYDIIAQRGGKCYFVGGFVRDGLLGIQSKDVDVEVFGISPEELHDAILTYIQRHRGIVDEVGKSFGVLKYRDENGEEIDFSIPRRERKTGEGHRGFDVESDPTLSIEDTASRRDFTINAIYRDVFTGEIVDPLFGVDDLKNGVLRSCGPAFAEDPLRVLRGMQFVSRFSLGKIDRFTQAQSHSLYFHYLDLPKERVWQEWLKWASLSVKPSLGIDFLDRTDWICHYPDIEFMDGVQQNPVYHPEGDVLTHTKLVCDAAADIAIREGLTGEDRAVLMFAALTHDMGKPSTTVFEDGKWKSPGHDRAGVPIARHFLESIGCLERIIQRVIPLVSEHMFPIWNNLSRKMVRRLRLRLEPATMQELLWVMEADRSGRFPLPGGITDEMRALQALDAELPPRIEPIITGRHLIDTFGISQGKIIGELKRLAFEGQLEEEFNDVESGIAWLKQKISSDFSSICN